MYQGDKSKNKKIVDIIKKTGSFEKENDIKRPESIFAPKKIIKEKPRLKYEDEIEEKIEKKLEDFDKKVEKFEKEEITRFRTEEAIAEIKRRRFRISFKTFVLIVIVLLLAGSLTYAALRFLPKAEIKITTKKTNWDYIDSVIASKDVAVVDANTKQIPGEFFSLKKNLTLSFPATGKQHVERKATGKITIYNAFSSSPQVLVAGTRFSAPDGKIFFLDNRITIPGAKISEGKIVASSVDSTITAEKPGAEYNIGPISRLNIPGFSGSAKYQGFYGELKDQLTNGFVGEIAVPTDTDIKQAREKTAQALKENIDAFVLAQIPHQFKILEGAKQFAILKENIGKEADANGNFLVFMEAQTSLFGFKETDLLAMITALAQNNLGNGFEIKDFQMDYGVARADFTTGKISFPINFKGVFWQPIDIEKIKQSIINKRESDLKTAIFSLAGVEKVTISLWPFWVKRVPDNLNRVKVEVE